MLDGRFKANIEKGLRPIGLNLRKTGITADHLTTLGVVMAAAAAVAIGMGQLRVGLLLLVLTGLPDALDGAVAKASGTAGPRGAFFDSVSDRVSDSLLLGGVAWYLASTHPGHLSLLPMAVLAASLLISYQRAKADALGFDARGGIMERAERVILLGLGLLFDSILVPILWVMLALTLVTAVQRFVKVWRQASVERPQVNTARRARRRAARAATPSWQRTCAAVAPPDPTPPPLGFNRVSATYKTGSALFRGLPRPVAEVSAHYGSRVVALASHERRLLTERNLQRVYGPEFTGTPLRDAVFRTFESYARYWVDSFRLPGMSHDEIDAGFAFEGYEHIARALASGVGPVIVLPHLGGWEWAAYWLTQIIGVRVTAVVEPVNPPELFEFFIEFRKALGMDVVPLGPAAGSAVLKAIKENHVTVLLADRDILGNGIGVDFFGERTTLPPGPVTVALRGGAALIPAGVYFRGEGHHAVVRPPMDLSRHGRFRDDVERITQDMAGELESLIRLAPDQWHLQQPNWPSDYDALAAIGKHHERPEDPNR